MDADDVLDQLESIESEHRGGTAAEALEQRALDLATGAPGRAMFLNAAGDHYAMADHLDDAERCFRAALDDGGEVAVHPWSGLLWVAFGRGDESAAAQLVSQLRSLATGDGLSSSTCNNVGEAFEEQERLREAIRWFTIPLRTQDPDDLESLDPLCLSGRFRVRQQLGLPRDRYDEAAIAWRGYAAEHHRES